MAATQLESALQPLMSHRALLRQLHAHVQDIVDRNQNPGCGGDRAMSGEQWQYLRYIAKSLSDIDLRISQVIRDTNPHMCEADDESLS